MKALQEQGYRIGDLCAAFCVSRSGYHRARTAAPSARVRKDAPLAVQLRELHQQSRGTYGRPRLTRALRQGGWRHSAKRVARLMRSLGLRGVQRGRFRPQTTDSRHDNGIAPNRLQEQAAPSAPDQIWVADLTYIPTAEGWLYVAGVLDGLHAFGWAKRVVCVNGLDLHEVRKREITLTHLLESKVRRAAETGEPFVSVATLFP